MTTLDRSISACLGARPADEVVLVSVDDQLSASVCRERVAALAQALSDVGVGAGDRVATLEPLSVEAVLLWWALDRLGAVFMPLNPAWTPRLLGRVLGDRRPVLLLADPDWMSVARSSAGPVSVPVLATPRSSTSAPAPWTAPAVGRDGLADCVIVHNSGLPGIHHGLRVNDRMLAVMGSGTAAGPRADRVLAAAPTCFMGTLVSIYGAVAGGGSVAVLGGLTAETFWPAVRCAGVTFAALVNPTLGDLMAAPESPETDRDHPLRLIAASPADSELNAAAARRFGFHWMSGLAKTEVCGAIMTGLDPLAGDGVGRVRAPFTGRILGVDDGRPVSSGSPGELVLRCAVEGGLPAGYADDPGASAELWRSGWMHTGWHLSQDTAGNLHPEGNLSVHPIVVKRAGYLFAADLEEEILAVAGGVTGARVLARPAPDGLADPTIIAWVTGDVEELPLCHSLRAGLPAHLVPDVIVPVRQLPAEPGAASVPPDAWML